MIRVANYGGGTNSTAMLIEATRRGLRLDLIVFADTGSERPETYQYLDTFNRWLALHGQPQITRTRWIRRDGSFLPLHEWCEKHETLPSKAFGMAGCTSKWKQQPADKTVRLAPMVQAEHAAGRPVERWIGYDADEPHRAERMAARNPDPHLWTWRAPLIEWDMGREECREVIAGAGLCAPGKSACLLCPSMRQHEIDALGADHPELLRRALDIEAAAKIDRSKVRGLGRSLNWAEYLAQPRMFAHVPVPELACGCGDGEL